MFISIDANTTLNTDLPIAYLEDVVDEQKNTLTRIVFAGNTYPLPTLVTPTPREDVVSMIEEATRVNPYLDPWERAARVFPAPTDTPLTQEQLPLDGEDGADYLNRVSRFVK